MVPDPNQFHRRFHAHVTANNTHELVSYTAFGEREEALYFEKYLKSHSGKAFANKRLW